MRLIAGWGCRRRLRLPAVGAGALALATILSACGDTDASPTGTAALPEASAAPLSSYDLVVLASAENNPLFADVYGVTLDPLQARRITVNKRISTLDANAERIVVAAADGRTDRLAFVNQSGELEPVPGIGRPFAYAPAFTDDGGFYYSDFVVAKDEHINRFWRWDPVTTDKSKVLRTTRDLVGPFVGTHSEQRVALGLRPGKQDNAIVVRDVADGQEREFPINGVISGIEWGADLIALTLGGADSSFGDRPDGLVLLDPRSGKQVKVAGYQAVAWTADGRKLLVRATDDLKNSRLALLDPADVGAAQTLGTIPNLAIFDGAWVRGVR